MIDLDRCGNIASGFYNDNIMGARVALKYGKYMNAEKRLAWNSMIELFMKENRELVNRFAGKNVVVMAALAWQHGYFDKYFDNILEKLYNQRKEKNNATTKR